MSRLSDAEAFKPMCVAKDKAVCEEMTTDGHCNYIKPCPNKDDMTINNATTVEERPQGEWIYTQYDGNPNIGNWHCSECRHIVFGGYSQKPYYNFCPNCGADMRQEAKE